MKILVTLSRFPYPIEKGDKLRAYHQIRSLSEGNEVHLICLNDQQPPAEHVERLREFCASVEVIPHPKWKIYLNLLRGFLNRIPFQVNYFRSGKLKNRIREFISERSPDVVYVQLVRLGLSLPEEGDTPYFLDYMDAFSLGMTNRLDKLKGPWKWMTGIEARRLRQYETDISRRFEGTSVISGTDAEALLKAGLHAPLTVIPNGVSDHFFKENSRDEEKKYDLIFTGNMGYHPNILAARYLVEEIVPEIEKLGRKVKVCIAGARPAAEVEALASDQVTVTGFVKDLRVYLRQSSVFVAPLFSGQGLQNKLLESMAMQVPTLTSPLANGALGAKPGIEIAECSSAPDFAAEVIRLLDQPEKARKMGEAGSRFIAENFNWKSCNALLQSELRKTIKFKGL